MNAKAQPVTTRANEQPATTRHRVRHVLHRFIARDGLALVVFALLAVLTMLPVLPNMRTEALGGPGDTHLHIYMVGWMAQAVALGESPFVDPRTNYPDDLVMTANDDPYLIMLLMVPLTLALGPTFTYNLILLVATWLTGYVTFGWIRHLTGSWAGGVIAGMLFMLAPARMVHIFGHLAIMCTFVVPLFFWRLDDVLTRRRLRFRDLLILGLTTFVLGATSQYMLILCLVIGALYTLFMVLPNLRFLRRKGWRVAESVVVGAGLSLVPDALNAGKNLYRTYQLSDIRHWAIDPVNFVLPSRLHPLWGEAVERLRSEPYWGEKTAYLGLIAVVLTLFAWRTPNIGKRRLWVWLGAAISSAVFALGHDLHINNQPVQPDDPLLLPAAYLAQVPFMNVIRVWPRFGILVSFFVACLAGVGVAYLVRRFPRWPVLGIVGILLLIDFLPPMLGTTRMEPRPVERWLAQQPGDFAVAFLPPFGPGDDASDYESLFGSLFHAKQLPAFNHPFHRSPAYDRFADAARDFPSASSVERLRALRLRYLLLERPRYNGRTAPAWDTVAAQIAAHPDLTIIGEHGDVVVVSFR
jgi:hypothetical protein